MTRDFAKKRAPQRRRRPQSQVPGWVWLFTGCVLGAFITFLVYLWSLNPESPPAESPAVALPSAPERIEPEAEPERDIPKPRFDFYKLLQDSEVIVPATEPEPPTRTQGDPEQAAAADPGVEYLLQVGSFRNAADADRLRAELLLLNLDAHTEQVTLREGERWHRVLVGPFDNQSRLSSARSTLVSNQYNALVLKRTLDNAAR